MTPPRQPSLAGSKPPAAPHPFRQVRGRVTLALTLVVCLVAMLRVTVAVPVEVESASMLPTYAPGDVVLVSRTRPEVPDLEHGDLVVFRAPDDGERALKRVVGLPGEVVVVLDGVLYVDGDPVAEPYVDHALVDGYYSQAFTVPAGSVFVLGDNRGNSVDSRDYGAVDGDSLLGRVLLKIWPVGDL